MEPVGSLPCSQQPANWSYPELDESSPLRMPLIPTEVLVFHLCLGLPSGFFPSGFSTKIVYAFLTIHDLPISSFVI
jgi:hypothetical protein